MVEFFSEHFYILCFYLICMGFLAGFIDAIAGGGGLISLPALSITGLPIALVLGTNKFQSTVGTSVATYKYWRNGLINLKTVFRGLVMGFVGTVFGTLLAIFIHNEFMNYIVPVLLVAVFLFSIFNRNLGISPGKKRMSELAFFSLFGFMLGAYDGFFGPGTGNFWVIAIVYFLGYTFLQASGYAKILNLKSNIFSLSVFLYFSQVSFMLAIIMAVGNFAGGFMGSKMVILKGAKLVRPVFIIVVGASILSFLISKF